MNVKKTYSVNTKSAYYSFNVKSNETPKKSEKISLHLKN